MFPKKAENHKNLKVDPKFKMINIHKQAVNHQQVYIILKEMKRMNGLLWLSKFIYLKIKI